MNISGIRPKQEFYAGMEKQEPEKKEMHRLNQWLSVWWKCRLFSVRNL